MSGDKQTLPEIAADPSPSRWKRALDEIVHAPPLTTVLSVLLAVLGGSILIVAIDDDVHEAFTYFFAAPGATFAAIWDSISGAYIALFQGAVYNFRADSFVVGIRPLTQSLVFATPLIAAGLGVAIAFRVGLFNIGGRGQMLVGAIFAGYASFAWDLPPVLHAIVAVAMGIIGGAIWGGIAGALKAWTGAHEVISTIMLNFVGLYLIAYLLRTPVLQAPGQFNPRSPAPNDNAVLAPLLGDGFVLHWGFPVVIAATLVAWWLIERSALGFRFRAVGLNPAAARSAGIKVERIYLYAMLVAGGFSGLAISTMILGTTPSGFTEGVDSGIGFDAITVALLGRSTPWGTFGAGLLFGALQAGSYTMQIAEGIPIDIVLVVQSLIVLFLAAPPLVRAIFRLPEPRSRRTAKPGVTGTPGAAEPTEVAK